MTDDKPRMMSIKLRTATVEAARIVSAYRGEHMAEMLSDLLDPILAKMEQQEVAKRSRPERGKGGKP
jgi:hypothetical protein